MQYSYYMTQRPPAPGAMPTDGLLTVEEYDKKTYVAEIARDSYAELIYGRMLTLEEIDQYELTPQQRMVLLTPAEIETICHALQFDALHGNGTYRESEAALFKRLRRL